MKNLYYTKGVYSDKVLVGDWVYSRRQKYEETKPPQDEKHTTVYTDSFTPKTGSQVDKNRTWDLRMDSEGTKTIPDIGRYEKVDNYFENFSTTYDLSYNHFPNCHKTIIPRVLAFKKGFHEPTEEYLPSYGNITKYGILDDKKRKWSCELDDVRTLKSTTYLDNFVPPKSEDYNFKRFATPVAQTDESEFFKFLKAQVELHRHTRSGRTPSDLVVWKTRAEKCRNARITN